MGFIEWCPHGVYRMRSFTRLIAIETIRVSSLSRLSRAESDLTVDHPSKCEVGLLLILAILQRENGRIKDAREQVACLA